MSGEDSNEAVTSSRCASCGIAENDDIKLKNCTACFLVKYCGIQCQKAHRKQHKRACKKRAAELRDELLFKQPESTHLGDCPICMVPLSLDKSKSTIASCCSKVICKGCTFANMKREKEMRLQPVCPFCRKPAPKTMEENDKQRMKRIEANDPAAMCQWAGMQKQKGNYAIAFEYYTKAAELGDAEAHYWLAGLYHKGQQGIMMDKGKYTHHLEEAAIGGHPNARFNLGFEENSDDNIERAMRHWMIAATQGDNDAMKALMTKFRAGNVSKEDLDTTLRAHKAAVDATKSPQREEAEKSLPF